MANSARFSTVIPPPFDKNKHDYGKWKDKLKMWLSITDLDKKKQGCSIVLGLDEETVETVRTTMSIEDLNQENAATQILDCLDKVYQKDESETTYELYEEFESYQRPQNMSINEYIQEFEKKRKKNSDKGLEIPDVVLAYRLLKSANITDNQHRMVRATIAKITYNDMKTQLKKVCSSTSFLSSSNNTVEIKSEPTEDTFEADTFYGSGYSEKTKKLPYPSKVDSERQYYQPKQNSYASNSSRYSTQQSHNYKDKISNQQSDESLRADTKGNLPIKRGKNPLDKFGNNTRCYICDSINHWHNECPDRQSTEYRTYHEEHESDSDDPGIPFEVILHETKGEESNKLQNLLIESLGSAVLDCGASKTVCGMVWLTNYISNLSPKAKQRVKYEKSKNTFKFGDGQKVTSLKQAQIPAVIGDTKVMIITDVIDSDLPLLLSQQSMKKAKTILNLNDDTVNILGQTIPLTVSTSGHYLLALNKNKQVLCDSDRNPSMKIVLHVKDLETTAVATKLHRQFCHPSADRLIKLVKNQAKDSDDLIEAIKKVTISCKVCEKYKKPAPRPVVGFPMASRFGECVAMDLKEFEPNVYLLHVIDHFTRLSAGAVIRNKKPETVIRELFRNWIQIYGAPEAFLTDNGGEFNNSAFRELGEKFNINIKTTAAYSPWSNGLVERHNAIMAEMVKKTKEDTGCSLELAVSWSVAAHNSLSNIHGFSPFQLVFSRNPTIPNLQNAKLPALQEETTSDVIRNNLEAMHSARRAYMASESSNKIQRALSHNVRTTGEIKYFTGDKVFYQRNNKEWKGPCTVLGQEGQQVLVKHGGVYLRVHPCRLSLEKGTIIGAKPIVKQYNVEKPKQSKIEDKTHRYIYEDEILQDECYRIQSHAAVDQHLMDNIAQNQSQNGIETHNEPSPERQTENTEQTQEDDETEDMQIPPAPSGAEAENDLPSISQKQIDNTEQNPVPKIYVEPPQELQNNAEMHDRISEDSEGDEINDESKTVKRGRPLKNSKQMKQSPKCLELKKGQTIKYMEKDTGKWNIVELSSRSGKAGGTYKGEWNTKTQAGENRVVDFERHVSEWEVVDESLNNIVELNLFEIFMVQNKENILKAKLRELQSWKHNQVYEEVPFQNQNCISSKWVIKPKIINGEHDVKARLVLKGYEEEANFRTDAPTCMRESVRIAFSIIASKGWVMRSIDFKTAFLQGGLIDRDIYMKPPKELQTDKIWKLRKTVYGLNDAPRQWYVRLKSVILQSGCKMCLLDCGLFYWHNEGQLEGILVCFVDDVLWSGAKVFETSVIDKLRNEFDVSLEQNTLFSYIGINCKQNEDMSITIDQLSYIDSIKEIDIKPERLLEKNQPVTESERSQLRSVAGQLNWACNISRPDMGYGACEVSTSIPNATVNSLINANKWVKHIKDTPTHVTFPRFKDLNSLSVLVYTDASYGNLPNGGSQGGQIVFLNDGNKVSPVLWHSRKVKRVVKSTIAAETLSLAQGAESGFMISTLMSEVITGKPDTRLNLKCVTDNLSLYQAAHSTNQLEDDRLKIDMAIIREMVQRQEIQLQWAPGSEQVSDVLTKKGASWEKLCDVLKRGEI